MRNGKQLRDILVIGKIIVKKVSEYSFINMETNMKACGEEINATDKAHIGEMKMANLEGNIQVIGMKIDAMVEVLSSIRMVIVTTDTGLMENRRVKEE